MAIQHFEPSREMISLREAMNPLFQKNFVRPGSLMAEGAATLPLDIAENEYIVKASMPGVEPEDVQITAHGDTLTSRASVKEEEEQENEGEHYHLRERSLGVFRRAVNLSTPINADEARTQFESGVLTLVLAKLEEAKPKQIKVDGKTGSQPAKSS